MASVNISIREDVYRFLKSMKRGEDESFSDVIVELKEKAKIKGATGKDLLRFAGLLKDKKDWGEMERNMKDFRKNFNKRMDDTAKYMQEARKSAGKK